MISLPNALRLAAMAIVLAVVGGQHLAIRHLEAGLATEKRERAEERMQANIQYGKDLALSAQAARDMAASAEAQKKVDDAKIKSLTVQRNALLDSLRTRPARPEAGAVAAVTTTPGSCSSSATGAQLYREDGEFLAREAARADLILAARDSCIQQYQEARDALRKIADERKQ